MGSGHHAVAGRGRRPGGLFDIERLHQRVKALAVFGKVNRVYRGSPNRRARFGQRMSNVKRGLPAELHQYAVGLFTVNDVQHIFGSERLKVKAVCGVVVGADGFWIAIDHDGLIAHLAQGKAGMDATVVKLNPLPNAVGPAA